MVSRKDSDALRLDFHKKLNLLPTRRMPLLPLETKWTVLWTKVNTNSIEAEKEWHSMTSYEVDRFGNPLVNYRLRQQDHMRHLRHSRHSVVPRPLGKNFVRVNWGRLCSSMEAEARH